MLCLASTALVHFLSHIFRHFMISRAEKAEEVRSSEDAASSISSTPPNCASSQQAVDLKRQVAQRFAGGAVGGVLQGIFSHPLDTIKSRLQTGVYPSFISCIRETIRHEGPRGFFKGVQVPVVFGGIFNSVLFSLFQLMQILVSPPNRKAGEALSLPRVALAAQLATPWYVMVLTPIERVKLIMQLELGRNHHRVGVSHCVGKIYRVSGFRGFFNGYWANVCVHLTGLPAYFVGYQVIRAKFASVVPDDCVAGQYALTVSSGVAGGILFWLACYPFDLIKTKMQASHRQLNIAELCRDIWRGRGFFGFYRGIGISLVRSIPANASVWLGLEFMQRFLKHHGY